MSVISSGIAYHARLSSQVSKYVSQLCCQGDDLNPRSDSLEKERLGQLCMSIEFDFLLIFQ